MNFNQTVDKINEIVDLEYFVKAIISSPIKKGEKIATKIEITKIMLKDKEAFQIAKYIDNKVLHQNITSDPENNTIISQIIEIMQENFKQCQVLSNNSFTILMNKKREFKISGIKKSTNIVKTSSTHNKQKNYILRDGEYIEWLYELNIMDKNGIVLSHMQKKFRQINKFLEMIESIEDKLPKNAKIIDMGCGKSYLTFAMYHYFNSIKNKNVEIMGFDLKKQVVIDCNNLAEKFRFENLKFYNKDIKELKPSENINMIISLHACDTATDYALYFGIKLDCDVILSVPCCQHELFTQIKNDALASMLSYGILKERFSSLLTDSIRADILKLHGYKANIIEFVDMEHTPKNIMIKAIKSPSKNNNKIYETKKEALEKLINDFSISPTLYNLLKS